MDYIIGCDAGGTKTAASAYDKNANLLCSAQSGAGNLTVNFDKSMQNIKEAIDILLSTRPTDNCVFLCIGCAGVELGDLKKRCEISLNEYFNGRIAKIKVINDAVLGLYSALNGEDGILVISGTGSIGYLKKGDELFRFGGWGHLINDDGSGYDISIRAIRAIALGFDMGKPETALKKAIFEFLNVSDMQGLTQFVYGSTKREISSLVPIIEKVANEGDNEANKILTRAGEQLASLAIGLTKRHKLNNPKIAISGSVLRKTLPLKLAFIEALDRELNDYILQDSVIDPPKAVVYFYNEK